MGQAAPGILLDIRTLKDLSGPRGHGNQTFQRCSETSLATMVLFDP